MTFYGLNIHAAGVKNQAALLTHLHKTQPSFVLVMDGLDLCKQIQIASPDTKVIHRNYAATNGDDDVFKRFTPQQWLDVHKDDIAANMWLHTTCEPGWSQEVIDWLVALMRLAIPLKVKLIIGGWSVGTPDFSVIPMAKTMLQLLADHSDLFILSLHEYANAVITSGFVGGAPNGKTEDGRVVHPDYVPATNWPLNGQAQVLTHWHMGRYQFWIDYCEAVNIKPPRIVLTEVGFDDVSDIAWWTKTLPHTGGYANIAGFKTLQAFWTQVFPNWSEDRAYYEQLKYAEHNIYQDGIVEGGIIYCYGHIDKKWEPDDVEEHTEFLSYLEADALTHTMTPNYTPTPFVANAKYTLVIKGAYRNLREKAGVGTGVLVGQVTAGAEVVALEQQIVGLDYWWRIRLADNTEGWVSLDGGAVEMRKVVPPPIVIIPPVVIPDVPPMTPETFYRLSSADRATMLGCLITITNILIAAQEETVTRAA